MAKKLKKKFIRSEDSHPVSKKLKKKKKFIRSEPSSTVAEFPVMVKGELLKGTYCNIASVTHTKDEFVLDFFFRIVDQSSLVSRVITSPQHTKKIYEVLGINIENYEKKFGKIKV